MKRAITAAVALYAIMIVFFPSEAASGAGEALFLCGNSLIPSLFPFMVCANLLITYGVADLLSRHLRGIMKPLFGVSGAGAFPLVMGLISGYPCGCSTVCSLYDNKSITRNEAVLLSAYTNNSGPLFIIGAVGIGLYNSHKIGCIIYIAHILSALSCGIVLKLFSKDTEDKQAILMTGKGQNSDAVYKAVVSVLTLCGYVVIFSVGLSILERIHVLSMFRNILSFLGFSLSSSQLISIGFFEITQGIFDSKSINLPLVSAVISLGGLSIFMQTHSILKKSQLPSLPYILGKFLCGGLSFAYTSIILKFYPVEIPVFSFLLKSKIISYSCYTASVLWAFILFAAFTQYVQSKNIKQKTEDA